MRKVMDYTVEAEGRDKGKVFQLTEMSAAQAERWALRAFQALARAGVDLGEVMGGGMQGLASAGLRAFAFLPFHEADPLLSEMFACVKVKPNPNAVRELVDDDIEEISTRLTLRAEVLKLHTDFLRAGGPQTSA
jgi:hypothetical protein